MTFPRFRPLIMLVIPAQARLHGCRAFGELSGSAELTEDRAVVERLQEQAAGESSDFHYIPARLPQTQTTALVIPAQAGIQWF